MQHPKLTDSEISAHMTDLPGWAAPGDKLERTYTFATEEAARDFEQEVYDYSDKMRHEFQVAVEGRNVIIALTTHEVQGITSLDFQLAQRIESAAADTHGHGKDGLGETHTDPLPA